MMEKDLSTRAFAQTADDDRQMLCPTDPQSSALSQALLAVSVLCVRTGYALSCLSQARRGDGTGSQGPSRPARSPHGAVPAGILVRWRWRVAKDFLLLQPTLTRASICQMICAGMAKRGDGGSRRSGGEDGGGADAPRCQGKPCGCHGKRRAVAASCQAPGPTQEKNASN